MTDRKLLTMDCLHFMKVPAAMSFFLLVIRLGFPTLSAWLIGGMADSLLSLDRSAIMTRLPWLIMTIVFTAIVGPLWDFAIDFLLEKKGYEYDSFLMRKYVKKELRAIEKHGVGDVVEGITKSSPEWCFNTCQLFAYPLGLVFYIAMVFIMTRRSESTLLFTSIVVASPLLYLLRALVTGKANGRRKKYEHEYSAVCRGISEKIVGSADWLRNWGMTHFYHELLEKTLQEWLEKKLEWKTRFVSFLGASLRFLDLFVQIVVLFSGTVLVVRGDLTPGEMLAGWLMLESIKECYSEISWWISMLKERTELAERIEIFYGEEETLGTGNAESMKVLRADDIAFSYDGKAVLNGVSYEISTSDRTRIIGENGAGKSTFVRILTGLYQPDRGRIVDADGNTISRIDLRKMTSLAEQDSTVFSGTVKDNLFTSDIEKAEHMLKEFGFQKSLDYEVGRNGKGLSPGERKKLILIRALLRNSTWTFLDEPLNHLDVEGAAALEKEIADRSGIVLITHKEMGMKDEVVVDLSRT